MSRAAHDAFIRARNELEQTLRNQPGYAQGLCALGVVDAALGNKEDAIREGERAVELRPVSKSSIEGPVLIQYLAVIYAWTGDKDCAIERLAKAAKLPGSHVDLRLFASSSALGSAAGRPALRRNCHFARAKIIEQSYPVLSKAILIVDYTRKYAYCMRTIPTYEKSTYLESLNGLSREYSWLWLLSGLAPLPSTPRFKTLPLAR